MLVLLLVLLLAGPSAAEDLEAPRGRDIVDRAYEGRTLGTKQRQNRIASGLARAPGLRLAWSLGSRVWGAATMGAVFARRLSGRVYLRIAQVALGACVVNVISGATVRLTDSGLGCADWPTCTKSDVTPPLSFHPIMEFANRMVVVLLVIAVVVAFLGSFIREERRRDLSVLSGALVAGVLGEAAVGAVVVYSKLNPYVVMVHFLLGMGLVALALALALRAGRARDRCALRRSIARSGNVARAMTAVLVVVLAAGTATTGAGPHAGGPGAKRIGVPLADMARTHSSIVLVLGALTLVELWLLHRSGAPLERGETRTGASCGHGCPGLYRVHPVLQP